jgi:hypothetical protein
VTDQDEGLARVVAALKEPPSLSPGFAERVMAEVRRQPPPARPVERLHWWRRRWTIRLSPLGGLAAAAALVAAVLVGRARRTVVRHDPERSTQFVLVAPGAKTVVVVGDFNDWSLSATPLVRAAGDGVWWINLPLAPGRYRYAFLVDGTEWQSDPEAPAVEDEFGRPNSVVTIGGA